VVVLASANRDAERFPEPDRFDVSRSDVKHIGFGFGPHFCLCAFLNRLEVPVALESMTSRFPALCLESDGVEWRPNHSLRGPSRLELAV
jgi:cytochrome P450